MATEIPDKAFTAGLTDYQFRLLAVLCRFSGQEGTVSESAASLGVLTGGTHRVTVQRALRALEDAGLISIERLRKAGGHKAPSRITVLGLSSASATKQCSATATSTGDYVATTANSHNRMAIQPTYSDRNTSYSYTGLRPVEGGTSVKEVKILARNRYDDGDDIGGFGLIDEPTPTSPAKVDKRSVKTRGRRPQEDWTANDVAAEFAAMIYKKHPALTGLMKTLDNGRALAAQRKRLGTDPLVELEMARMFVGDERNLRDLDNRIAKIFNVWLGSWSELLPRARKSLGVSILAPRNEGTTVAPAASRSDTLVSSDGTEFEDTIAGRAFMRLHEERLARSEA